MQNRVINISMIAAAAATTTIPVSCVERGRWSSVSKNFEAAYHAPPSVRSIKTQTVHANRARTGEYVSDQGAVWASVDSLLNDLEVTSQTSDMSEIYKQQQKRIKEYRKNVTLPTGARGVIFVLGKNLLGVDMFDSHTTLKKYWKKLSEAYFMEASKDDHQPVEVYRQSMMALKEKITENISVIENQVGEGAEFEVKSEEVAGTGVWYREKVCHLSAFSLVQLAFKKHLY